MVQWKLVISKLTDNRPYGMVVAAIKKIDAEILKNLNWINHNGGCDDLQLIQRTKSIGYSKIQNPSI